MHPRPAHDQGDIAPAASSEQAAPPESQPATAPATAPADDDEFASLDKRVIWRVIGGSIAVNVLAQLFWLLDFRFKWGLPWQPILGMAMITSALLILGGFFIATRRARIAIGATIVVTFLVMLTVALTLPNFGQSTSAGLERELLDQFKTVFATVIGFYFGTEVLITGSKIWATARTADPKTALALKRVDRDV